MRKAPSPFRTKNIQGQDRTGDYLPSGHYRHTWENWSIVVCLISTFDINKDT